MPVTVILALIQAAATLIPEIAQAMPSVEAAINGTATDADVANIQAVTMTLNTQVAAAETAAGATGPSA